jgi:hypothetical protein
MQYILSNRNSHFVVAGLENVIFIDINSSAITEPFSKSHGQSFE